MKISLMSLIRLEKAWYDIVEESVVGKPAGERRRTQEVAAQAMGALKETIDLEFPFSVDLNEIKSTEPTAASVAQDIAYPRFLSSTCKEIRQLLESGKASSTDVQTALTVEDLKQTVRQLAAKVGHCRATIPALHCEKLSKKIVEIEQNIGAEVEKHVSESSSQSTNSSAKKKRRRGSGRPSDTASTVDDSEWIPAEIVEESGRVAERAQELIDLVAHVKKRADAIVPIMQQEAQSKKKKQKRK